MRPRFARWTDGHVCNRGTRSETSPELDSIEFGATVRPLKRIRFRSSSIIRIGTSELVEKQPRRKRVRERERSLSFGVRSVSPIRKATSLGIWSMNFRRSPVGSAPAFQRIMHPHSAGRSTPRAKGYERRIAEEPTEFSIPNGAK